jgi:hypothetical protein
MVCTQVFPKEILIKKRLLSIPTHLKKEALEIKISALAGVLSLFEPKK